jgi:hypothetical protein
MPLIKPMEMNAPRQAASAFPSSERPGVGLTMGCRIDLILRNDISADGIKLPSSRYYQHLQLSWRINHKKIKYLKQRLEPKIAEVNQPGPLLVNPVSEESCTTDYPPMDPREQFWTDEFYRYSAECRRLARLARKPTGPPEGRLAGTYRIYADWLGDLGRYFVHPAMRPRQLVAGGPTRRYLP